MQSRTRAAAVMVVNDRILLVNKVALPDGTPYWIPPGGGLEPTDASLVDCLVREVREETGLDVTPGPLAFVREFVAPRLRTHQIELFFQVRLNDPVVDQVQLATTGARVARWFDADQLRVVAFFPPKLAEMLTRVHTPRYLGVCTAEDF